MSGTAETVFDVIRCAPAVRRFTDAPVAREVVSRLVEVAVSAPSPRNLQPWEFVAAHGEEVRRQLGEAFAPRAAELETTAAAMEDTPQRRMYVAGAHLARSVETAAVTIFVCGRAVDMPPPHDSDEVLLSALFTAAQNLRVAARALGLGSAFTNLHVHAESQVREILGLPDEIRLAATIPLGWPAGRQGKVRRRPVEEVLHWDGW